MSTLKILPTLVLALACNAATADTPPASAPTPFGDLNAQLEALATRVDTLENNAPNASVEGRTYCMMVHVSFLRSIVDFGPDAGPARVEDRVIRRVATFVDGTFTGTLVSSYEIAQVDNDVVEFEPGASPDVILGSYWQTGNQLDVQVGSNPVSAWYVSKDGSLIHNNGIGFFGPFGNGLSLGLVRNTTFVESDTCAATTN